jgi:hypothetical protein
MIFLAIRAAAHELMLPLGRLLGIGRRKTMHTLGHAPNAFHEPLGFVDTLALLTLASAIGMVLVMTAMAITSWLA